MNIICRVCQQEKPIEDFGVNKHIKSGINSMCKDCGKEATKIYREKNPEKIRIAQAKQNKSDAGKARMQKYRINNPDKVKESSRNQYAKNREKILANAKINLHDLEIKRQYREREKETIAIRVAAWQKANKDKCVARSARYRERFPDAGKEYYRKIMETNPGSINARLAKRRCQKKNAVVAWKNDFFIREIYQLSSLRTKLTGINWHVDHIVPLQSDIVCGLHWEGNMQIIPAKHNSAKRNRYWPDMPEVNHG